MSKEVRCPYCNIDLDAHTGLKPETTPSKGDYAICFICTGLLRYNSKMYLVKASTLKLIKNNKKLYLDLLKIRDALKNSRR